MSIQTKCISLFLNCMAFTMSLLLLVGTIAWLAYHPVTNGGAYPAIASWFILLLIGMYGSGLLILEEIKAF